MRAFFLAVIGLLERYVPPERLEAELANLIAVTDESTFRPPGRAACANASRPWGRPLRPSAPAEDRLSLVLERARALLRVLAPKDLPAVRELVGERVDVRHAVGLVQRAEHGLDSERPILADHLRDLARPGERLAVWHHVADEPDRERLARREVPAGQQDLRSVRVGNLPAEAYRRASHGIERPAHLGDPETRA